MATTSTTVGNPLSTEAIEAAAHQVLVARDPQSLSPPLDLNAVPPPFDTQMDVDDDEVDQPAAQEQRSITPTINSLLGGPEAAQPQP
ncbi:hypothetical protein R1sor_026197 [Riccia sorocarpa]|uniref:Uncharacterized protein n=1 Tax=Riccia sorocarpa TaxID=122646 RepID=A0ABD3GGD9_9MARC